MSRLTSMTPGHGSGTPSFKYGYAGLAVAQASVLSGATFVPFQAFGYDQQRSLTAVGKYDAAGSTIPTTVCLVHDALGRLTAVGPALARLSGPGATACEKEGDLASVTVRFHYDAMNRRVARQDGSGWIEYVHDPGAYLLAEVTRPATAGGAWSTKREYVWLDGQPLAQLEYPGPAGRTDGYTYYFHLDHLGQPRALTSESGATVWSAVPARPYGDVTETQTWDPVAARNVATNLRLPGQYDEKLFAAMAVPELKGPYYNWNRWYLPSMGRYMELDPIAVSGGFNEPFGPNWYGYAEGNPLQWIDPTGLTWEYCLDTGDLTYVPNNGGPPEWIATGYAGIVDFQTGVEAIMSNLWPDTGPLPAGLYRIGRIGNHKTQRGVMLYDSMRLTPLPGTDMGPFNREGFLIHNGDFEKRDSSTGCPVLKTGVRKRIAASGDKLFRVVRCR